ncbi:MAG: protein-L-isoaspartate(D-aspartate) O-methyltransferase [Candidatus Hodarchaeales archaeon]
MNDFKTQKERLIEYYRLSGYVKQESSFEAFMKIPRELFVPASQKNLAYVDRPLALMNTGQTISAPHMTVMILDYLELQPGMKILEIGSGSGYQAALIASVICSNNEVNGHIYSLEIVPELVTFARENIRKAGLENCVTIIEKDGTLGFEEEAPYDRVIITAAGPSVPPPLMDQVKPGGFLVIPLGRPGLWQQMTRFRKTEDGKIKKEFLSSVAFVPLRGKYGV